MRLLPRLDGLPRSYWILLGGAFINRLGGFVAPFLALYLTGVRGLSVEKTGLVVSLYGAGAFGAAPLGGLLADRLGRRATMLVALCGGALAMLHLGLSRGPAHIALAAFVLGLVGEQYRPAMQAAVSDLVPAIDRPRAYGFLYWAVNLGFACASVLGGLVAEHSYLALFVGDAATTLAFGVVVWTRVPETRPPRPRAHEPHDYAAPYRDGVFLAFVGLQLAVALLFQQCFVSLPIDMRAHGLSPERFGLVLALNGVLIVCLQPTAVALVGRARRSRVLALGALLTGAGFGLNALAATSGHYLIAVAVWTLGEIALSPVAPTVVADLSPPALRGSYQGAFMLAWGLATLLAPTLGTQVMGRFGGRALWLGCLAVGVAAAFGHLAIAPARRGRLAALKAPTRTAAHPS